MKRLTLSDLLLDYVLSQRIADSLTCLRMYTEWAFQEMVDTLADVDVESRVAQLQFYFIENSHGSLDIFFIVVGLEKMNEHTRTQIL